MIYRSTLLLVIGAICMGLSACAEPQGREPINIKGQISERPSWALRGAHDDFPSGSWYFASHFTETVHAPSQSQMYSWLTPVVHAGLGEALKAKSRELPPLLQEALPKGMWVSQRLLPDDKVIYQNWSNGVSAAAYITVSKADIANHLALRPLPEPLALLGAQEDYLPALEVFSYRTRRLGVALERVAIWVLSEGTFQDAELTSLDVLVKEAESAAEHLQAFRQELLANLSGGRVRLELGTKPESPILLTLRYRGEAAAFLPLEAKIENLNAQARVVDADPQTNSSGSASIRFVDGLRYTGKTDLYLGFRLAPDKRLPELQTGLEVHPWHTRVTLPSETNVVVFMGLVEKNLQGASQRGALSDALEGAIRGNVPMTSDVEAALRGEGFVLEIGGVIHTTRLSGARGVDQLRAEGAIILRHYKGPAIASVSVQGFADIRGEDIQRAETEALENIWAVHGDQIRIKMREAFPPLMR